MSVTTNALALLHELAGSSGQLGDDDEGIRINVRRAVEARVDMVVNFPRAPGSPQPDLSRIARAMNQHLAISEAKAGRNRIDVRFAGGFVDGLAEDVVAGGESLRPPASLAGERWVINLFDPNATKAMHIGHLRNVSYGMALGRLCEAHGATVSYQSVVNDMGRNVAETISAYMTDFAGTSPSLSAMKPDHFVGRCYSTYVARMARDEGDEVSPGDEPIWRELREYRDAADEVITRWFAGDPEVRKAWSELIDWTVTGHQATFERCGLDAPKPLFQSSYFGGASKLVSDGLASGLLQRSAAGSVFYETGRDEYPRFPLTRPDGMSTEHLRTVAAWEPLVSQDAPDLRWIHVLGDEWRVSTECRVEIFERMGYVPGVDRYSAVYHGMVTSDGGKLSSAAGDAILIDDELARLSERADVGSLAEAVGLPATVVARMLASGLLLSNRPTKWVQYAKSDVLDDKRNPTVVVLDTWAQCLADIERAAVAYDADSPERRHVVLRSQLLPTMIQVSWERRNPENVLRYLQHFSQSYGEIAPCASLARVIHRTLTEGMTAIGLLWHAPRT